MLNLRSIRGISSEKWIHDRRDETQRPYELIDKNCPICVDNALLGGFLRSVGQIFFVQLITIIATHVDSALA